MMSEICSMGANVPAGIATDVAKSGRIMRSRGLETMEKTRKRKVRIKRHAERFARDVIRRAGKQADVGRAIDKRPGTLGHYCTDRPHPVLVEAFEVLIQLNGTPGVSAQAFAEAASELVELSDIVTADTPVLIERALYLLEWENEVGWREDQASMVGKGEHAKWLRVVASASSELASLLDELRYREVDAHELFRERGAA